MQVPILEHMSGLKNRRISILLTILIWVFADTEALAQHDRTEPGFSVLFYNVENLFDTQDDPTTEDDEFSPGGLRNWNSFRLKEKLNKISKVVVAASGYDSPAIIGLCEVENRWVLEQLVEKTALSRFNYRIIHKDSPDDRGIDVAILFRPDKVIPIDYNYHPLVTQKGDTLKSREILEAAFKCADDTLNIFVNHWPSRYNGQAQTEPDRLLAAETLKTLIDSLLWEKREPKIVILGDFNDEATNRSIHDELQAKVDDDAAVDGELVNLSFRWRPAGTLKHQQSWQIFDQIIVSDYLLEGTGLFTSFSDAHIVDLPFLFEDDDRWGGKRLFRTYRGYKYTGGFSDHLPVLLKIHH